jgi:hypothetical protein
VFLCIPPFVDSFPFQSIILSNMNTNTMFQILNEHEVRLMGRKYLYSGESLFYVQDREDDGEPWTFEAWKGESVTNPYVLQQFRNLQKAEGWMDSVLNIVSDKRDVIMDRWEYAIRQALRWHPHGFRFQELVHDVCLVLGAEADQAMDGIAYHPYTGKMITNVQGWIATWIEERSPDSRQRYFVAGKRYNSTKPLLFVNDKLYEANMRCEWRPYSYVRGGLWRFDPAAAQNRPQPDEDSLNAAELLYRKQGMRGAKNRTAVTRDIAGTERVPNIAGIAAGFMATLGAVAAVLPNQ